MLMTNVKIYAYIFTSKFIIEVVHALLDFTKIHVYRGFLKYVANTRGS